MTPPSPPPLHGGPLEGAGCNRNNVPTSEPVPAQKVWSATDAVRTVCRPAGHVSLSFQLKSGACGCTGVGGGCQSGWGRLLLVTNANEAGTWRGRQWLGIGWLLWRGGGGASNASLPAPRVHRCPPDIRQGLGAWALATDLSVVLPVHSVEQRVADLTYNAFRGGHGWPHEKWCPLQGLPSPPPLLNRPNWALVEMGQGTKSLAPPFQEQIEEDNRRSCISAAFRHQKHRTQPALPLTPPV